MQKLKISDLINKSIDFIKAHYEYILPFSLLYVILQLPSGFIKSAWMLPLSLLLLPLAFSIPYFANKVENGEPKRFGLFFEVYSYFFKFFGIAFVKWMIMLLIFSPLMINLVDVLKDFNYDAEKLMLAIQTKNYIPNQSTVLTFFGCMFLFLFLLPFIMFVEFYAILDDLDIMESFKKSYEIGVRNYMTILLILIVAFAATFAGMCTCGIGLVLAIPFIYLLFYYAYKYNKAA